MPIGHIAGAKALQLFGRRGQTDRPGSVTQRLQGVQRPRQLVAGVQHAYRVTDESGATIQLAGHGDLECEGGHVISP